MSNERIAIGLAVLACLLPTWAEGQAARKAMDPAPIGNPAEWFSPDNYPPDAVRAGRSGRVVADLGLDSTGRVASCTISQSSGTTSLDQKTCDLARDLGRFNPATDRKGRPIVGTYRLPVRWVLPDTAAPVDIATTKLAKDVEFEVTIGVDGSMEGCRTVTTPPPTPDPCSQAVLGRPMGVRYVENGAPVRAVVRQRYSQSVRPATLNP